MARKSNSSRAERMLHTPTAAERDPGRGHPEQTGASIDLHKREETFKGMSGDQLFGAGKKVGGATPGHLEAKIANTQKTSTELFGETNDIRGPG